MVLASDLINSAKKIFILNKKTFCSLRCDKVAFLSVSLCGRKGWFPAQRKLPSTDTKEI
jgi:hypothetical protein